MAYEDQRVGLESIEGPPEPRREQRAARGGVNPPQPSSSIAFVRRYTLVPGGGLPVGVGHSWLPSRCSGYRGGRRWLHLNLTAHASSTGRSTVTEIGLSSRS